MANDENASVEENSGSSKKLLILITALLLVLIIAGGGVAYALLHDSGDEKSAKTAESSQSGETQENADIGALYPLDEFTVNIISDDGIEHYLKTQMNLEIAAAEVSPELDKKKAELRDIIIGTLSSKSMEELSTATGKENLKKEIINQINSRLAECKIKNVYFTDFVEQ